MSRLPHVPLGNPDLDRFQQAVARAIDTLERDIVSALNLDVGLVPVASKTAGAAPVTFDGLDGDATGVRGYVLKFRARAGAANTQIGIRFNADVGANYRHASVKVDNTGSTSAGSGSDADTAIVLCDTASFDAAAALVGTVQIPISVSGENRHLTAETGIDGSGGIRGYWTRGRWSNATARIAQIQIVAVAGSIDNFVGTLYRTVR